MNTITETPLTDAVAQNFHVIAATEKIQVSQYVKAWQCRDIETQLKRERDEAREAYEAETASTAELVAENLHLEKRWKTDNFYFCGMMQLLKEHGIAHGSKDLIAAGRQYEESESQIEAAVRVNLQMHAALLHVAEQWGGQLPHEDCDCNDCAYLRPVYAALEAVAGTADEKPDGQAENASLSHGDENER